MTLRVTLEIVPYGEEHNKYEIGHIDVSNVGGGPLGFCSYIATQYTDGETVLNASSLTHMRQDGPWVLVKKAIESLDL